MFWYQDQRHVWGYLIAAYMRQRDQLTPSNYKEFLEMNGKLNQIDENEFLAFLDLERTEDYNVFDLKDQSYQKLKTSYKNHLKSIR